MSILDAIIQRTILGDTGGAGAPTNLLPPSFKAPPPGPSSAGAPIDLLPTQMRKEGEAPRLRPLDPAKYKGASVAIPPPQPKQTPLAPTEGAPAGMKLDEKIGAVMKVPRGIRNNNPGNIKATGTRWNGEVDDDGTFEVFDTPENGMRALAKVLKTYQREYKLDNIEDIIMRFAPPQDKNDTKSYVNSVSKATGFKPREKLDLKNKDTLHRIMKAIIKHENGVQPYDDSQIDAGIKKAFA